MRKIKETVSEKRDFFNKMEVVIYGRQSKS